MQAGIEVILDVVYNHTAEGNAATGPLYSFKGIDNSTYYLISERPPGPVRKLFRHRQHAAIARIARCRK